MLDLLHLSNVNTQILYANANTAAIGWQTWQKPRGANFVNIFLLAGGGGGCAGAAVAATSTGGGGGGSSAQFNGTFNLSFLPDTLYFSIGYGGNSGNAGNGGNGVASYFSLYPNTAAENTLVLVNGGVGGSIGSVALGGTATAFSSNYRSALALLSPGTSNVATTIVGQSGTLNGNGGVGGVGANLTLPTTGLVVTGGTGGGGTGGTTVAGNSGGSFVVPANSLFASQSGGTAGTSTTNGGNGNSGFQPIPKLLYFYGGTGGGSGGTGAATSGGNGGNGSFGCGGGGGGGGFTGGIRSLGGRGGNGICILTWW